MSDKFRYVLGAVDWLGTGRKNCEAAITWDWDGKRFSMSAEVWKPRKDDIYCGGQCVDEVAAFFPGDAKAQRMVKIWQRYHLNAVRAGSAAQMEFLHRNPIDVKWPQTYYDEAKRRLRDAGLDPDPVTGYSYGSAWLFEELPPEVKAEIESWRKT